MKKVVFTLVLIIGFSVYAVEAKKNTKPKSPAPTKTVSSTTNTETKDTGIKKEVLKPSKLQKEFLATTGIVLGEYTSDSNIEDCDGGKLSIVDYGDELGLIFGAGSLVVGIGKDKLEESYSDCKRTFKSKYIGNVIEELSEETCSKDGKTVVKTTVTAEKNKLSYVVNTIVNDGTPEELKCSFTLKNN